MIQKWKKLKKNEKGLTLIELLAVLVILGIIAAIVIPLIANVISDSRDKAILADASNIISAAKLAQADGKGEENGETLTFDKNTLDKYLDKVTMDDADQVTYSNSGWQIKYARFNKIKSAALKKFLGIENNNIPVSEDKINQALEGNIITDTDDEEDSGSGSGS